MVATQSGDFDVRRVLVVGAGAIGMEIAAQCAAHGVVVHVHDVESGELPAPDARRVQHLEHRAVPEADSPAHGDGPERALDRGGTQDARRHRRRPPHAD